MEMFYTNTTNGYGALKTWLSVRNWRLPFILTTIYVATGDQWLTSWTTQILTYTNHLVFQVKTQDPGSNIWEWTCRVKYLKFRLDARLPWGLSGKKIHLPVLESWVWSLVQKDITCCGATKPVCHKYWASALEPVLHSKRSHCNEKPLHCDEK